MRIIKRVAIGLALTAVLGAVLFTVNGASTQWRVPELGRGPGAVASSDARTIRVMALNVAKCWFHHGGLDFATRAEVLATLERIAATIRAENPDLVFLSEVILEAAPVCIDQVEHLSRSCGFAYYASSENYSFGLPFCRIRSGNALLSRFDTRVLDTVQLAGDRPAWNPSNNRRALFCEIKIDGAWLLGGSIRNDSFDLVNNLRQMEQILAYVDGRPALLAGDFNAEPHTPPIRLLAETQAFTEVVDAPPTYPADAPARRIDQVFAPRRWRLLEHHTADTGVSDHLAVVATFALE